MEGGTIRVHITADGTARVPSPIPPQPTLLGIPVGKEKEAISPLESAKGEGGERGPLPTFYDPRTGERGGGKRGPPSFSAAPFSGGSRNKSVPCSIYVRTCGGRSQVQIFSAAFLGGRTRAGKEIGSLSKRLFFRFFSHQQKAEERRDRLRSFPPLLAAELIDAVN